jgi:hypothetical protein
VDKAIVPPLSHDTAIIALFQAPAGALPVTPGQLGLNHFAVQVENLADLKEAYAEFQLRVSDWTTTPTTA